MISVRKRSAIGCRILSTDAFGGPRRAPSQNHRRCPGLAGGEHLRGSDQLAQGNGL
jgi:hypothetical protein